MLEQARFGKVTIAPFEAKLAIGGAGASPQEAAAFVVNSTHMGRVLKAVGEDRLAAAIADLAAAFTPHHIPGKGTLMGGKAWLVTALAV